MLPMLMSEVMAVEGARMGVNYGIERVRFTAPVPTGSEVRLHAKLLSAERRGEGVLYRVGVQIEIRGAEKPALVGEVLYLVFA
jgi:acyl dehydratase